MLKQLKINIALIMQHPIWKQRALTALEKQAEWELNSGYDERESLIAVSAMQKWVESNTSEDQSAFLKQLDEYYQQVKQNWAFTGKFGGGTATLGSCHYAIQQAVLNPEKVIQRRFHRVRHQPVISYEDSSAIINSHWRAKHYPHWFQGWPVCLKVELKSLAVGLLYCLFMYLLYSAFF